MKPWIIGVGSWTRGYECYGPFGTEDDARKWATHPSRSFDSYEAHELQVPACDGTESDDDFEYWQAVLDVARPLLAGDPVPDFFTMTLDAAKDWMRGLIWNQMKMQDYTNQSQNWSSIAFTDAILDVTTAIYRVAFDEPHDVHIGPAFGTNIHTGEMVHINTYEDAKRVIQPKAAPKVPGQPSASDRMPQDLIDKLRKRQAERETERGIIGRPERPPAEPSE